jgi:hypothetical protein
VGFADCTVKVKYLKLRYCFNFKVPFFHNNNQCSKNIIEEVKLTIDYSKIYYKT